MRVKPGLYGALELARSAIWPLVIVCICATSGVRLQGQSFAASRSEVSSRADSLDQFAAGAWHLAIAIGRAECAPAAISPEIRALIDRDLLLVRHGGRATGACFSRAANLQTISARESSGDLKAALWRTRIEYEGLAHDAACWNNKQEAGRAAISIGLMFPLADAAAGTVCGIAGWKGPLQEPTLRGVIAHLTAARSNADHIAERNMRRAIIGTIDSLHAALSTISGEAVYERLVSAVALIRQAIRTPY